MGKILVTGGAGFIGSNVVNSLLSAGHAVSIIDNLSTKNFDVIELVKQRGADFTQGDIRDQDAVEKAMIGCDHVIHLAAQTSVPYSIQHPEETYQINVIGTQLVFDTAVKFGVTKIISASSAAVYGNCKNLPLDEDDAGELLSPYASSKWENERQIIGLRDKGQKAVSLRFFNVYGVGQNVNGGYAAVIPAFVNRMVLGKPPHIFGDGNQTRDFIHVDDVSSFILQIIENDWFAIENHAYNVATQTTTSLQQLVNEINSAIISHSPTKGALEPIYAERRDGDIIHSVASSQRSVTDYGWSAKIELSQGINELVKLAMMGKE